MQKIFSLSEEIISKIAAGEVIERPVYAVKELIENSIDAGTDSITVHIEESGLKTINIIDNGEGMGEEDIKECFKPHATSKLLSIDDLSEIRTLGFRGEALSSIAAISRLKINSRTKDDATGTSVVIHEGKIRKISPIGMPVGTNVFVENLFHTVPGRKKFLKSQRTEFRRILETVMQFALAHPHVQFILTHNGKTILDLPKTKDVSYRLQKLFGNDISASFIPLSLSDGYINVSGYIAKPQVTTKSPHNQFLYVNNRKIIDRTLANVVRSAYGTLLDKFSHPVFILFLQVPYEIVDVNVHPRKEEVRFTSQQNIFDSITRIVSETLSQYNLNFTSNLLKQNNSITTHSYAGQILKDKKMDWILPQNVTIDATNILQIHKLFLLAQTSDGFVVIDQHAAHERILFEQFSEAYAKERKKNILYNLPKPFSFELSLSQSEVLLEHLETFQELGFVIEHFKNNIFYLSSLPLLFQDREYKELIAEILTNLQEEQKIDLDILTKKMLAYLACRRAVKAGDDLTQKQCKELIEKLEKTNNNATCPHGRPTKITVEERTLERMFKR